MNTHQAIQSTYRMSRMVLNAYLGDLDGTDLLHRPGPGCNHAAWQLGHLVASEAQLLGMLVPDAAPDLPEGFAEAHGKEQTGNDDPANFLTKAEYLALLDTVQAATLAALEKTSADDLDAPAPEMLAKMFPTVGDVYLLIANHPMMHAGQLVPIRRALDKPVVI